MRRSECFLMRSENFKEEARTMEKTILKAMQVIVCALGAIIGLLFLIFIKIWKQVKWQSIHLPGQLRGGDSDHEREVRRNGEVFSWKCNHWFSVRASQAEDNPGIRRVYRENTCWWFRHTWRRNQGQTMSHMMKKEVLYMSTEKVIAILAALLADQENVKVSYEIHKDNYAEEKTA